MRYPRFKTMIRTGASPAVFFLLGVLCMWLLAVQGVLPHRRFSLDGKPLREGGYKLINPLLLCSSPSQPSSSVFAPLKKKLDQFIKSRIGDGSADTISVYFRDLLTGRWIGSNEDENYTPASLLKVPIMVAFLKAAESNPALLSKKILYDGSFDYNAIEGIKPLHSVVSGRSYTLDELLSLMIVYSDNNAYGLLFKNVDQNLLVEVYTDLGLSVPPHDGAVVDFMSPKIYSSFLRILYNATYLDRQSSEKALELLSESNFPQGIRSGVLSGVTVAEKFGERTQSSSGGTVEKRELHDCGIVFYPGHPYLLCIMTSDLPPADFNNLADIIREISAMTYQEVKAF